MGGGVGSTRIHRSADPSGSSQCLRAGRFLNLPVSILMTWPMLADYIGWRFGLGAVGYCSACFEQLTNALNHFSGHIAFARPSPVVSPVKLFFDIELGAVPPQHVVAAYRLFHTEVIAKPVQFF